ncbi:MAG: peptide ABC transporter substrate-binding protein [Dehalococcoidales bacterium]|nr:peptide ABC transporter substrate-binding protein [Dehalococcoidales bacterium]
MIKRTLYILTVIILVSSLLLFYLPSGCQFGQIAAPVSPGEGEVLNLYGIDPNTLDPAVAGEANSHRYIMQLFSGLVRLDDNLEPAPDIAREWRVSDDGRTFTFELRRGVRFHDGREVKAGDFEYAWRRAADPATGSLTAATYLGDIVGVSDVLSGKSQDISGVRVLDDYTLQVTIDAPKSYFLSKLTYVTAFVVDRNNVASGSKWWQQPNGTGPFKLKQWEENSLFVLERNGLYYGQTARVSSVVFHLWSGVPMNLYETGEIDVTEVGIDYIDKVSDEAGPFYDDLVIVPELSFSYVGFNATRPPFDDAKIRQAFSMAIDKEKLVSLVFRDMMQPADGILPPGMPGFNESLRGLDYDVNRAQQLIRESSYGDVSKLPQITITTGGWGGLISQGLEAIVYQWRQNLGVEVKVRQMEPQRFFYFLKEEKDEMFDLGWIADYPHPQDFLDVLFRSGAENNYGEYRNPEVDALLDDANVELDEALSLTLYRQAEQKLVEDAASLPLWFGQNYILVKPYVEGYRVNPMGFVMLNEVSVKPH